MHGVAGLIVTATNIDAITRRLGLEWAPPAERSFEEG